MTEMTVQEILEELASAVVMTEVTDKPELVGILDKFESIGKMLPDDGNEKIRRAKDLIGDSVTRLNNIVLDDTSDVDKDWETVTASVSDLQHAIRDFEMGEPGDSTRPADEAAASEQTATGDAEGSQPSQEQAPKTNEETPPTEDPRGEFYLPDVVDEATFMDFLSSQKIALDEIEDAIMGFENGDDGAQADLKRRIHTMKGEAGVLGMEEMSEVCHAFEDYLDGEDDLADKVDKLLQVKDWFGKAVESYGQMHYPNPSGASMIALLHGDAEAVATTQQPAQEASQEPEIESEPEAAKADEASMSEAEPVQTEEPTVETPTETPQAEAPQASAEEEDLPDNFVAEGQEAPMDRDEETITMLSDFLQEGTEGLANADDILMNIENEGVDSEKINGLFRVFHTLKGVAGFLELEEITSLAHTTETMLNQVRQGKRELVGNVLDYVFDATEMMREMLDKVRVAVEQGHEISSMLGLSPLLTKIQAVIDGKEIPADKLPEVKKDSKLGEVLQETAKIPAEKIEEALSKQRESGKKLGQELVSSGTAKPKQVAQALRAQKSASSKQQQVATKIKETVKVDLERVDSLVEMIGELVIVESMVVNDPDISSLTAPHVRNYLGQLTKISRDLQNVGMRMRMVPVRGVFQKMARMVRDLSRKSGKEVKLVQSGEGTEMDRSMVERIGDPLVHMIRNSVDHGIEATKEDRINAGKEETGTIYLSAYHEGGSIVIEIEDDGRGLNKEAIVAKALKQGVISENDNLTDQEIYNLIFAPGFSTAAKVTEISGRGVGMDVVKKNIESMRGRVILNSTPGKGTLFKMVLPLTTAIIDGMLVKCGKERYIIPTLSILESIQPNESMLSNFAKKGELINLRGEILPIIRLDRLFKVTDAQQNLTESLVVVLEGAGRRIGLVVDDVLNQQQVVIKSLGSGLEKMKFASGAAILSDGRVGLILNVDEIGRIIGSERETY